MSSNSVNRTLNKHIVERKIHRMLHELYPVLYDNRVNLDINWDIQKIKLMAIIPESYNHPNYEATINNDIILYDKLKQDVEFELKDKGGLTGSTSDVINKIENPESDSFYRYLYDVHNKLNLQIGDKLPSECSISIKNGDAIMEYKIADDKIPSYIPEPVSDGVLVMDKQLAPPEGIDTIINMTNRPIRGVLLFTGDAVDKVQQLTDLANIPIPNLTVNLVLSFKDIYCDETYLFNYYSYRFISHLSPGDAVEISHVDDITNTNITYNGIIITITDDVISITASPVCKTTILVLYAKMVYNKNVSISKLYKKE